MRDSRTDENHMLRERERDEDKDKTKSLAGQYQDGVCELVCSGYLFLGGARPTHYRPCVTALGLHLIREREEKKKRDVIGMYLQID